MTSLPIITYTCPQKGIDVMQKKPLIETNPHLAITVQYRKALVTNVASSTAIETGASVESITRLLTEPQKTPAVKKTGHSPR